VPRSSLLLNAEAPLAIPTYDGSGQCVHPDVINLDQRIYPCRYLMVMEPYPFACDALENPSLVGSNDGTQWAIPHGVANPLVPAPGAAGGWHSDADILYRDSALWLYYRYNSGLGETTLRRITSVDGTRWSPPASLFTVPVSGRFASPALIDLEGRLHLIYVDTLACTVGLLTSLDGVVWSGERELFHFHEAWHLDAMADGDAVYVLLNDRERLFLLRSDPSLSAWALLGAGGEWVPAAGWSETTSGTPILGPSPEGWDDRRIYRSSLLLEHGKLRIWYSAQSTRNVWSIGYTDGPFEG
jgi:hypothetical protein